MANERLIVAIGQMERALGRIESAQMRLAAAGSPPQDDDLVGRHAALKAAASQALTEIDAILSDKGSS